MKKILFFTFIFFGAFGYSQNQVLFNVAWQIEKIKYQDQVVYYFVPTNPDPIFYRNTTHFSPTDLYTLLFNSFGGSISSITPTQITVSNLGSTLVQSPDSDFDLFENYYGGIFNMPQSPRTFNYAITSESPYTYKLVLTDVENNNQVFYYANILSTETLSPKKIKVYPNPTSEILNIENSGEVLFIKIYDNSGKLIQQTLNNGIKNLEIDVKHLPTGIYFLKLNDDKTIKFIKN